MSMMINHNLFAQNMAGLYNKTTNALHKSLSKLASGLRTSVTDFNDASGMEIAQQMTSKLNGFSKAMAGGQDGISLLQTAEGALTEVDSMLQRMRELATQAANDTLTGQDRAYIQAEIDQLRSEIDRIGNTTRFNNKALLNGNAAALWSAIPKETQAIIKGGLKSVDQFGQKFKTEGNYNIKLTAMPPGEAEVQKTSVFNVKSEGVFKYTILDTDKIVSVTSENLDPDSEYTISSGRSYAGVSGQFAFPVTDPDGLDTYIPRSALSYSGFSGTGEISITVKDAVPGKWNGSFGAAGNDSGTLTLQVEGFVTREDGTVQKFNDQKTFTATPAANMGIQGYTQVFRLDGNQNWAINDTEGNAIGISLNMSNRNIATSDATNGRIISTVHAGDNTVWNFRTLASANVGFKISSDQDLIDDQHIYNFVGSRAADGNYALLSGREITFNQLIYDKNTQNVNQGSITIKFADDAAAMDFRNLQNAGAMAKISSYQVGEVAGNGVKLSEVDRFYDDKNNFLLDEPQNIKITQGDGKTANITLYASDTLGDVAKKINDAIANDLGQKQYVDDANKFATFVDDAVANTSEAVAGTFLIRSAVSGSKGTLRFSGSETMMKALGLNTIQEATESVYEAEITDAHSGEKIASAKVTGNTLNGILNENVDVEFDAMAGVSRAWDSASNAFKHSAAEYKTTVHLADNSLTFQMGIGSNQDMLLSIGDMRSQALGLNKILVTNREAATRAVTIIDDAIDKVSTQRAKLGAYVNRIEYNLDNMRIAEQNITSAESNIKDTDMAREIMNFTKLQIMIQAGNSMLAQANQTQENVLSLVRQ